MQRPVKVIIGGVGGAAVGLAASALFVTPGCACGLAAKENWEGMTFVERALYRWNGTLPEDVVAGTGS